jgi:hypothetical protein
MRYKTITAANPPDLERGVNQAIRDGYEPEGGITVLAGLLVQALVHRGLPPFGQPKELPQPYRG